MELIKNLWRGDIPLAKAYWLFGVLPGIIFNVAFRYAQGEGAILTSQLAALFFLGIVLLFYVYSGFICVAIWRSATKYRGMARYAILAKIAVILGAMALIKTALDIFGVGPHS